jgi:hypothetical protein
MGWLKEEFQGCDVEISDEGVGVIEEAVHHFVRHYEEDTGRRPTLDEFLASLQHVLVGGAQDFFGDLQEKRVTGIRATTAKAKRRQSFVDGDYFVIPLARNNFAYGRVLFHRGAGGYVVEIYELRTELPVTFHQLLEKKPEIAFARHVWARESLGNGRWRVIGHVDIPSDYRFPRFYMGYPSECPRVSEGPHGERRATLEEVRKLEPCMYFGPEEIEERLRLEAYDGWPEIEYDRACNVPGHKAKVHEKLRHIKWPP